MAGADIGVGQTGIGGIQLQSMLVLVIGGQNQQFQHVLCTNSNGSSSSSASACLGATVCNGNMLGRGSELEVGE